MDASCKVQGSIHVFSLVHKYVSRILGTYHLGFGVFFFLSYAIIDVLLIDAEIFYDF